MIDTLYIEEEIAEHPRVQRIESRFPDARRVFCRRYGEVFNRNAQNFRLQKRKPALILAQKFDNFVLEAPTGYGIGSDHNFYFSHMLNCLYDCRYCFLQGMYRSAHYLLFVNYEDFETAICDKLEAIPAEEVYFFSGYDCDSLALESLTGFAAHFVPFFARHPRAWIELRTKSNHMKPLLTSDPIANCVVASSFTPAEISTALEHNVPPVPQRITMLRRLQRKGWKLGLRFDPLIYHEGYRHSYGRLFAQIFAELDADSIHSVSIGAFRLPKSMYRRISRMYPEEKLFASRLEERRGMITFRERLAQEMMEFCLSELSQYVEEEVLFRCPF